MQNASKYTRQYFLPPVPCTDWVQKDYIEKAPIWCSVDPAGWQSGADRSYDA